MLSQRGIEANPEKCKAIIKMRSPTTIKEVQRLIGRLSHFPFPTQTSRIDPTHNPTPKEIHPIHVDR